MKKTISTTLDIDATPEEIWDVLTDFPAHEKWNPFFARIVGEATVGTTIKITARKDAGGDGMSFSPTVLEADPGRMLRWKGKFLVNRLFDGEHSFELTDLGDGRTRLDHGEKFSGILIRLMGKVLTQTEVGFTNLNTALADEVAARRS